MYEYLPIKQVKIGDIIERTFSSTEYAITGKLYIVSEVRSGTVAWLDELGSTTSNSKAAFATNWKLVKTKPGSEANVGDSVIVIDNIGSLATLGSIHTVLKRNRSIITQDTVGNHQDFLVLCKVTTNPFKAGDKVRYVGPIVDYRPKECSVVKIRNEFVYYTSLNHCHYSNWELIPEISMSTPTHSEHTTLLEADESQHPTNTKENTMNPDKLAACISKAITEETKKAKAKTDFQNRKRFSGVIYNAAGKYVTTVYSNKSNKLDKAMQQPEYLGMTMVTHEAKSIVTTNIPLVITDLKN